MEEADLVAAESWWLSASRCEEALPFWKCFHCGEVGHCYAWFQEDDRLSDPQVVVRCSASLDCWLWWLHECLWVELETIHEMWALGKLRDGFVLCDRGTDCLPRKLMRGELRRKETMAAERSRVPYTTKDLKRRRLQRRARLSANQ
jgi:hypothetical protein